MAQKAYSLSHTKWMCSITLCSLLSIDEKSFIINIEVVWEKYPSRISVSSFMGYLKGKSALMMFDKHANLKYKFGNRHFWEEGYYMSTVGLNEATIKKYIQD